MTVSAICSRNVATIESSEDIPTAAERMRRAHVGDLIVIEYRDGRQVPIGIITDRDVAVAVVAKKVGPETVTVGDAMSTSLLTVREDDGIELALREMRRVGVRRTPVVDESAELVGVLSIDDVIDHLAVQLGYVADVIRLGQQATPGGRS